MKVSVLQFVMDTERVRQRAASGAGTGFSRPVLCEHKARPQEAPFLATNSRSDLVLTRASSEGRVRFAFAECLVESEATLLNKLYEGIWSISSQHRWHNRCSSLEKAVDTMKLSGIRPKAAILGPEFEDEMKALKNTSTDIGDLRVLVSDQLTGRAMLTSAPDQVGMYVRSGDYLALLFCQADKSVVLVGNHDVA